MKNYLLKTLDFEVSNPCNEKCIHCYRHCFNKEKGFMTCKDIEYVLKETEDFIEEKHIVVLTGGEFFLNPEWKQIVKTVSDYNRRFCIYTNGTLISKDDVDYLAQFVDKGLKEIQLSLYGIDEQIHDSVTGLKGSCEKTKNALMMLKERNIPLFVSCCAMQQNKDEFYKVMKWCDDNDIRSSVHLMIFGPSDYSDSNKSIRLTEEDFENFFNITMENNGELSYIWGRPMNREDISDEFYYHTARELCITPSGDVYSEIGWYKKIGNIYTNRIKDIFYKSDFMNKLREYKISEMKCSSCPDFDYCTRYPVPHVTANNGEPGKYDQRSCDYIHLIKSFAERRDQLLRKEK